MEFMECDVCPDCILFAKRLEKAESILDIEGGIFALKISEAYRDVQGPSKRRSGKAA